MCGVNNEDIDQRNDVFSVDMWVMRSAPFQRNVDHMRDTRLAGSVQQAARALDIDPPGMVVPTGGGMDHHINALDCLSQACAGLQISLLPLRTRPIISRSGPSTHPTHGIPC